jgi:hypothetical protein
LTQNKSKDKLPSWFNAKKSFIPVKFHRANFIRKTALYKSTIVSGSTLIDLTEALVDDYYFSKKG